MERYILQYLAQMFAFAREFLALLVLKRKGISDAFSKENFAIQFATFGILFAATANYLWYSTFTETNFARSLAGTLYMVVCNVIISVCAIAFTIKLFKRPIQTNIVWRSSIVVTIFFTTLFSILFLFETGKLKGFNIFWSALPHQQFSHDVDTYISIAAWSAILVYALVFSYVAASVLADFHYIDRVKTFYCVGSLVSLPILIISAPILSVMYSIIGVTHEDMVFVIQDMFGTAYP